MIVRLNVLALTAVAALLVWLAFWGPWRVEPVSILRLGSTTSTQDSGLLDHLIPLYSEETGVNVVVIAKGTGAAIRDGLAGQVDALLVHNQAREEELVAEGYAVERLPIMSNNFLIVGSKEQDTYENLSALVMDLNSGNLGLFLSRGDESGTHAAERRLWESYGLDPRGFDDWYTKTGTGMGQTLITTNMNAAATLVDSATWAHHGDRNALHVWFGDAPNDEVRELSNPYGYLALNEDLIPGVNTTLAQDFGIWLAGPTGQQAIADYSIDGMQAFVPHSF